MSNSLHFNSGDLTSTFDECRKQPDGESIDQLRANYFIDAAMNERGVSSAGGLAINPSGIVNSAKIAKEKEKHAKYITTALKLMNDRLAQIEARLVDKYGEDFAENLAAEYLDEDTYKKLMSIQDKDERRRQIAQAINEGIENGSIDPDAINENPDFAEWLDVRRENELNITSQKIENSQSMSEDANLKDDFGSLFDIKP